MGLPYRHRLYGLSATRARVPDSAYLAGQFAYYVAIPAAFAAVAMLAVAVIVRWRRFATAFGMVGVVALLALPFYLIGYTGGV